MVQDVIPFITTPFEVFDNKAKEKLFFAPCFEGFESVPVSVLKMPVCEVLAVNDLIYIIVNK